LGYFGQRKAGNVKNLLKAAPLLALIFVLSSCGGGGAGSAEEIGKGVVEAIKAKKLEDCIKFSSEWGTNSVEQKRQNNLWLLEVEQLKWKENFADGNLKQWDPEGKSGIDSKDKYKDAAVGVIGALHHNLYKMYKAKKLDDRLAADFWLIKFDVRHGLEGDASSSMTYANKYNDTISVTAERVNGVWYMTTVGVNFPEEAEKNPTVGGGRGRFEE